MSKKTKMKDYKYYLSKYRKESITKYNNILGTAKRTRMLNINSYHSLVGEINLSIDLEVLYNRLSIREAETIKGHLKIVQNNHLAKLYRFVKEGLFLESK